MLVRYLKRPRGRVLATCAFLLAMMWSAGAQAQTDTTLKFDIPAQGLQAALSEYARQSGAQLLYAPEIVMGKNAQAVQGDLPAMDALKQLLTGTGLYVATSESGAILIGDTPDVAKYAASLKTGEPGNVEGAAETSATAAPVADAAAPLGEPSDTASGTTSSVTTKTGASGIEEIIVTAQKKSENIQDVPIAISAFSAEELNEQKLEGGPDLLRAIPNVTFSKNNFSGYNFSIRGIGTKAVSVTTDPGVAVASNNISLIRNRLFEQEYFDVSRVEVLRGPQGTLYGRNATGGVINVLTNKAKLNEFDGSVKMEVGNYDARRGNAFVNIPLIDDMLAIRGAGSFTYRSGYDYNTTTGHDINGRDLWSGRVSALFQPVDSVRANFMWERFSEDDDRSRTGKQLCHHDAGPESIGSYTNLDILTRAEFSQGCKSGSLYDKDAFGTPNGLSIPFMLFAAGGVTNPHIPIGVDANGNYLDLVKRVDPYGNKMQSTNLREIASIFDPTYQAKADLYELNIDVDVTPELLLSSQTGFNKDNYYSSQDYNRFNSDPVFNNSAGLSDGGGISNYEGISPGGVFCDPQLGCSNTIAGLDISRAKSEQFSQELRLASSFDGPFNFSVGANYTHYKTEEDYFVMYNVITGIADLFNHLNSASPSGGYGGPIPVSAPCTNGYLWLPPPFDANKPPGAPPGSNGCIYVDPNPIGSIDGNGHNYFRSRNPYTLSSYGLFGETYWQLTEDFKITAGLRYNDDRKSFTRVPTQVLLAASSVMGGTVDGGYPVAGTLKQKSDAFTGRLGFDWKVHLPFTQKSMVYAFYSRGYKAGGLNPPGIGYAPCSYYGLDDGCSNSFVTPSYPLNFRPEYVNAFEVGSKNALLGGSLILNATAFFYDYKDYQVSKIVDRTAINENFDAKVWGAELESLWQATPNLRFNMALGYQGSRLANGSKSIDLMDRLQGHGDDYVVMKPWVQLPSNCVVPRYLVERAFNAGYRGGDASQLCPGGGGGFSLWGLPGFGPDELADLPNGGQGFYADLSGNELPNAPHWTASLGAAYTWYLKGGWETTLRADYYRQGDSYARVYNDKPYDRLRGWGNGNVLVSVGLPSDGLTFELYAKNVFNDMPITDAFLNSDDTSLTTNVFTLDPRLFGFSIRKDF